MASDERPDRLSQLSTSWTVVFGAHDPAVAMQSAREALLRRYERATRAYLRGALRDEDAAEECYQEFAYRLVRGDFRRADPRLGSFRKYLKTVLLNLVREYERKRRSRPGPLPPETPDPVVEDPPLDEERFQAAWRDEAILRALHALEAWDGQSNQHLYTVLRLRMDHPDLTSEQMAERLAPVVGKPLNSQWIRKRLHNARHKFAELLLDDIAGSLEDPTDENVEEELSDLGLLDYCRTALQLRRRAR